MRRFADLPWHGRIVEIQLHARRFRCVNSQCPQRIFTERLPETVRPKARRTARLGESQLAVGFAAGGEPGSRLARKLAMPVSGDTLLRMIRAYSATIWMRRERRSGALPHIWCRFEGGTGRAHFADCEQPFQAIVSTCFTRS